MSNNLELSKILISTATLKVLSVLVKNPDMDFSDSELHKVIPELSMASVNNTLKHLYACGLTERKQRGKLFINKINENIPELRYFKLIANLIETRNIIKPALKYISKAILYGSYASGENDSNSDIDIFIVSEKESMVRKKIKKSEKLQLVIKNITELATFKDENEVFWNQVENGIVLWESTCSYEL